jgi:hypothetical protein
VASRMASVVGGNDRPARAVVRRRSVRTAFRRARIVFPKLGTSSSSRRLDRRAFQLGRKRSISSDRSTDSSVKAASLASGAVVPFRERVSPLERSGQHSRARGRRTPQPRTPVGPQSTWYETRGPSLSVAFGLAAASTARSRARETARRFAMLFLKANGTSRARGRGALSARSPDRRHA